MRLGRRTAVIPVSSIDSRQFDPYNSRQKFGYDRQAHQNGRVPREPSRFLREAEVSLRKAALLALADGSIFRGVAIGVEGQVTGEVVFNTSMTGYQEILTDPSYAQQIVTLTYPHIGNVGTNAEDEEADSIHCAGLVIRDLPLLASSWRSAASLEDLPGCTRCHRYRRYRYAPSDPNPARAGRTGRLHRGRRSA